jgi:hypothetical protein
MISLADTMLGFAQDVRSVRHGAKRIGPELAQE